MNKQNIIVIGAIVLSAVSLSMAGNENMQKNADEIKMLQMEAILRNADVDISFFGRVLDQNDAPVAGANAEIQVTQFSPNMKELFGQTKSIFIRTDEEGFFFVEKEKGRCIYIKSISKTGFDEALLIDQNRSYQYASRDNQKPYIANKSSPVVFVMRKQGETAFCLENKYWYCQISAIESGKSKGYDFIRQYRIENMSKLTSGDEPVVCDLTVKATFNTNNATWAVVLSPGNTNGGIIVSEQLRHEAPEAGYQPEYFFVPEDRKPVKAKYIYLKSRYPAIYMRLEMNEFNAGKMFCRLNGNTAIINPYGERNLEQATDLPYEVTKQLTDEAKEAFRQNKLPPKPDLTKLVKEFREKAEKAKQ